MRLAATRSIARTWAPGARAAGSRYRVGVPTTPGSLAASRSTASLALPLRRGRRRGVDALQFFLRDHSQVLQLVVPVGHGPDLADHAALDAEEHGAHPVGSEPGLRDGELIAE